jgi:hypothetical protein
MLYARKIEESAWMYMKQELDSDSIADVSTSKHELSVWQVPDDLSTLNDIALALALSRNKADGLWVVLIDTNELERSTRARKSKGWQVQLTQQEGNSRYTAMNCNHINFVVSDIWEQGYLSIYIKKELVDKRWHLYYFDLQSILNILRSKIDDGIIDYETFKSNSDKWISALDKSYPNFKESHKKKK